MKSIVCSLCLFCCRLQSIHIALKVAGEKAKGSVLASDAFMPFPDNVEISAQVSIYIPMSGISFIFV